MTPSCTPWPMGVYKTIVIDPPWPMKKMLRPRVYPTEVKELEYKTMLLDDIYNLPVYTLFDTDCHVYLWTTHRHLPHAFECFNQWGVKYHCLMTWVKPRGFTPHSFMFNTEHVLFGRVGNPKLQRLGLKVSFEAKPTRHSEKPDVFYSIVEQVSQGPRIDLFARKERGNDWSIWGDEV